MPEFLLNTHTLLTSDSSLLPNHNLKSAYLTPDTLELFTTYALCTYSLRSLQTLDFSLQTL